MYKTGLLEKTILAHFHWASFPNVEFAKMLLDVLIGIWLNDNTQIEEVFKKELMKTNGFKWIILWVDLPTLKLIVLVFFHHHF